VGSFPFDFDQLQLPFTSSSIATLNAGQQLASNEAVSSEAYPVLKNNP
jgi:hypothetical protein